MQGPQNPTSSSNVAKLPAEHADGSASVAASIVATWSEIDVALTPIIGHQGVAALYKRSVHLALPSHPWLAALTSNSSNGISIDATVDLDTLRTEFSRHDAAAARAAGDAMLRTFFELLTNLIGASLTERLLHSVWVNFLSDPSQQDTLP